MDTDGKALLIRVYRRESVVQFLWLRLAALRSLRLFAAISLHSILRTLPFYQDIAKIRIFPLRI